MKELEPLNPIEYDIPWSEIIEKTDLPQEQWTTKEGKKRHLEKRILSNGLRFYAIKEPEGKEVSRGEDIFVPTIHGFEIDATVGRGLGDGYFIGNTLPSGSGVHCSIEKRRTKENESNWFAYFVYPSMKNFHGDYVRYTEKGYTEVILNTTSIEPGGGGEHGEKMSCQLIVYDKESKEKIGIEFNKEGSLEEVSLTKEGRSGSESLKPEDGELFLRRLLKNDFKIGDRLDAGKTLENLIKNIDGNDIEDPKKCFVFKMN